MENSLSNFFLSFLLTIYQYVYVLVYTLIILVFFPLATSLFATNNIMYIMYGFGRKLENIYIFFLRCHN